MDWTCDSSVCKVFLIGVVVYVKDGCGGCVCNRWVCGVCCV